MTLQVRSRHCYACSPFPGATKNGTSMQRGPDSQSGLRATAVLSASARSPVAKAPTNRPAPPPFSPIMARHRRWLPAKADLTPSPARGFVHSRREARQERMADALTPRAKFLQAEPKPVQAGPRKRACIFLDSFVQFGAFQWVTSNQSQKRASSLCRQALPRRDARNQTPRAARRSIDCGERAERNTWRSPSGTRLMNIYRTSLQALARE